MKLHFVITVILGNIPFLKYNNKRLDPLAFLFTLSLL